MDNMRGVGYKDIELVSRRRGKKEKGIEMESILEMRIGWKEMRLSRRGTKSGIN